MKFAVISPTTGLRQYSTLSNLQMALAHVDDRGYWNFYRERREAGDIVILDNGAYENGSPQMDLVYEISKSLKPQIIILPDFLMQDPVLTVSASLRYLDKYGQDDVEYMFVPQAPPTELDMIYQAINAVLSDMRVGRFIKWIGLPRALHTHFFGLRPLVARNIKRAFPNIKLHALGSGNGSVDEFHALSAFCESMDSSSPVWRGWSGYDILDQTWPDIPVDFFAAPPTEMNNERILNNLKHFGIGVQDERTN